MSNNTNNNNSNIDNNNQQSQHNNNNNNNTNSSSSSSSSKRGPYPKEDRIIHNLYQLTHIEKEKVKVWYRQAQIKGYEMYAIPEYIWIASKYSINVSYGLIKTLKQMQYESDRSWFYEHASDSVTYMGCYRLAIDKLEQLEKQMWLIIMNPKVEVSARVMATREIHSIIKTGTMLMRDLPYITNLSKLYDISDMGDNTKEHINKVKKQLQAAKDPHNNNRYKEERNHFFDKNTFDGINSSLVHNIIENTTKQQGGNRISAEIDADVVEIMQDQLKTLGYETDPDVQAEREKKRKEAEKRYIEKNLQKIDSELANISSQNGDEAKVAKLMKEHREALEYLDSFISPEHRNAITRIREISDDDSEV